MGLYLTLILSSGGAQFPSLLDDTLGFQGKTVTPTADHIITNVICATARHRPGPWSQGPWAYGPVVPFGPGRNLGGAQTWAPNFLWKNMVLPRDDSQNQVFGIPLGVLEYLNPLGSSNLLDVLVSTQTFPDQLLLHHFPVFQGLGLGPRAALCSPTGLFVANWALGRRTNDCESSIRNSKQRSMLQVLRSTFKSGRSFSTLLAIPLPFFWNLRGTFGRFLQSFGGSFTIPHIILCFYM